MSLLVSIRIQVCANWPQYSLKIVVLFRKFKFLYMNFDKYFIQQWTFLITVTSICFPQDKLKPTPLPNLEDNQDVLWEV